jgi:hypothetical protein
LLAEQELPCSVHVRIEVITWERGLCKRCQVLL